MKYQTVIFDLDGTIADTSPGILNCHRYAHQMLGRAEPSEDILRGVIGGPLLLTYQSVFNSSEQEARRAIAYYRQRYAEKGLYEATVYPGMKRVLRSLKEAGCQIGLATLKAERFLKVMLENMEIEDFFDTVCGMDDADRRTKAQLIELCMRDLKATPVNTVLVGDSVYDQDGAQCAGISFLGVTYGFGFKKGALSPQIGEIAVADSCTQLLELLL